MPKLINAFDSSNEFERSSYFTICFNTLPSHLRFKTPLNESRENMEAVMAAIDFEDIRIKEVFKNWNTEDAKNADSSNDYPYQYLLKSEIKKLVLWISLENDELVSTFLYDATDPDLERWVISANSVLRAKVGVNMSPVFKVLYRHSTYFLQRMSRRMN